MITKDQISERVPVLQAWLLQSSIQSTGPGGRWITYDSQTPPDIFNEGIQWRLKPKPREWWVTIFPKDDHDVAFRTAPVKTSESVVHVIEDMPPE
jgi:hypothetical protein